MAHPIYKPLKIPCTYSDMGWCNTPTYEIESINIFIHLIFVTSGIAKLVLVIFASFISNKINFFEKNKNDTRKNFGCDNLKPA